MKTWVVHAGMLLAICVATYLYNRKFAVPTPHSMVMASLEGSKKYLRKGASIRFICNVRQTNYRNKELYVLANSFTHYVLAPVSLNQPAAGNDTTLIISPVARAARVSDSARGHAAILWEHTDNNFHYLLIHKPYAP